MLKNMILIILFDMLFSPSLNSIQDGLLNPPSFLKSVTDLLSISHNVETCYLYLSYKRTKKYMNHVAQRFSSADIIIFSPEISNFFYINKYS